MKIKFIKEDFLWILLRWNKDEVQIFYTFIGVEKRKNSHYKAFKNGFLFDEYTLIHEAATDDPGTYARNNIKSTFKKSNGTKVTLVNSFTTRHFSGSNKKEILCIALIFIFQASNQLVMITVINPSLN